MNKVIAWVKRIRIGQFSMAFLAGILLLVSTACSNATGTDAGMQAKRQDVPAGLQAVSGKKNPRPEVPEEADTNRFRRGTMNEFSDVDPRAGKAEATAAEKAAALKENAERNLDEPGNIGDKIKRNLGNTDAEDVGKNLKQSAKEAKNKAENTTEDLSKASRKGVENVKDNTQDSANKLTGGADRTAADVKETAKDTADELTRGANRTTTNVRENAKDTGNNLIENAQQAIENTGDFLQGK